MSHFTRIKTQLVKKEYLVQALRDLGYKPKEEQLEIRGFGSNKTIVDIMIPTKNPGYDIVADWYGIKDINPDKFLNQIQQRYSYNAVISHMSEQGFEVVTEENQEDKTIHLTVRRAVC